MGLAPDGDAVLHQLQSSPLLPARRADLHMRGTKPLRVFKAISVTDGQSYGDGYELYLDHTGALQHPLHVFILLHSWKENRQRDGYRENDLRKT